MDIWKNFCYNIHMNYKNFTIYAAILMTAVISFFIFEIHPAAADKPKLLALYVQDTSGRYDKANLVFNPGHSGVCYIYRKESGGEFSRIASVRSKGGNTSYTDRKLPKTGEYIYTVRSKTTGKNGDSISDYDHTGISTIRGKSIVTADITNLRSELKWSANENASGYTIYRRIDSGKWKSIATVGKNTTTYTDVYSKSFSKSARENVLLNRIFLDTSSHTIAYTVRGLRSYSEKSKRSLSPYDSNGYYNFGAPIIVDAKSASGGRINILFTRIRHATKYLVSSSKKLSNGRYEHRIVATLGQADGDFISCSFKPKKGYTYINVTAVARRNGKTIQEMSYDGFTNSKRKYSKKKILYIGDSITFGTPYKSSTTIHRFSYPYRIGELTNAKYYNAAIPGATMAFKEKDTSSVHRYRIITDVVPKILKGTTPVANPGLLKKNTNTFSDFDTIVICAGTNDYTDAVPIGNSSSKNQSTYYGALNSLMTDILKADNTRVKKGKSHITVIMPDLFYSDRCGGAYTMKKSRYSTKNSIGYTLKNYNDAKNKILEIYKNKGLKVVDFKTSSFVNQNNCPYSTADNLHMTKYTYEKIGNALAETIIKYWK